MLSLHNYFTIYNLFTLTAHAPTVSHLFISSFCTRNSCWEVIYDKYIIFGPHWLHYIYDYLRPSLATFNHMNIFLERLYIYLQPSLALTLNIQHMNINTITLSSLHLFHFMFLSNSIQRVIVTSTAGSQRWIDTTLLDWYIWFGLLHLHNAI